VGVFHNWGDYEMRKSFKDFYEEMTSTVSVAGAGDDKIVPVHLGKKKKKKPETIRRNEVK
jgi:hypothetical protein